MPRKPRVHFLGAHYHVMLRGNGGMPIFSDQDDRRKLLDLLQESVNRFQYRIHAYCLMTNHVHIAMQVSDIPLSKIIQNISFRYTRFINRKQKRIGHLFQGRYKALLVDAEKYLLQLIRYIHLNPIRANMVKNLVEYPWSSHQAYLGYTKTTWLTTEFVFNLLTQNPSNAKTDYRDYMQSSSHENPTQFDHSIQKSFPTICDDSFMLKLEKLQQTKSDKAKPNFDELVKHICNYYLIDKSALHLPSRNRLCSKIRLMIAGVSIDMQISNLTTIANYFQRDIRGCLQFAVIN